MPGALQMFLKVVSERVCTKRPEGPSQTGTQKTGLGARHPCMCTGPGALFVVGPGMGPGPSELHALIYEVEIVLDPTPNPRQGVLQRCKEVIKAGGLPRQQALSN